MKRLALPLLVLALAACQDSTSPTTRLAAPAGTHAGFGPGSDAPTLPPPPQYDTISVSGNESNYANVNVAYFLNKTGTNGFLTFKNQMQPGVVATPSARVSFHNGVFSGRGTLTIGSSFIDLSSVTQDSRFGNAEEGYFNVTYSKSYNVVGNDTIPAGPAFSTLQRVQTCDCQ